MLADRFLRRVCEGGVAVGPDANVLLHVSTPRLGETSSGAVRSSERNYSELGGLAGGDMQPRLPATPATRMMASRSVSATQPLLVVPVDATAGKDARIARVASMQCRLTESDEGLLAQELPCHRQRAGDEGRATCAERSRHRRIGDYAWKALFGQEKNIRADAVQRLDQQNA
jgi:hypothetical protein